MIPVLVIFNGNIFDVVGKRGRILGIVIFIFNISFKNDSYVFVKIVQREPLYEAIGRRETPGLCIFG